MVARGGGRRMVPYHSSSPLDRAGVHGCIDVPGAVRRPLVHSSTLAYLARKQCEEVFCGNYGGIATNAPMPPLVEY